MNRILLLCLMALSLKVSAQSLDEDTLFDHDTAAAQEAKPRIRKYPSRLWEISGNGLKQPSYLYGTMHVSKKLAFNLGDTFYRALQSVDVVALELAIDSWLGNIGRNSETNISDDYGGNSYGGWSSSYGGFYKNGLEFTGTGLSDIIGELNNYDYLSNYLLYRQGFQSPNYSEKTYVDMYIHQVGKKLGKYCTGLEDFELSRRMVWRSDWRERVLTNKGNGYNGYGYNYGYSEDPTETAYREGDLDLIDSMDRMSNDNKFYRKWMLFERNKVMANKIDEIIKTQRLFAAVGCAHLPGDSGVIECLRRKGYTVKPIYDAVGDYAFKQKLKLDANSYPVQFHKFTSHSGELEFELPGVPVDRNRGNNEEIFYADVANGAYYIIKRIPWYGSMKGISCDKMLKQIDSALYENVPGDITAKERLTVNGNPALLVSNKTKSGETQRHMFLVLQNHIWYVKLSATGDYAAGKESKDFFKSIELKPRKTHWDYFEPQFGGYKMYWPAQVVLKPYSFDTSTDFRSHENMDFTDEKNNYYFFNTLGMPGSGYDSDTFNMHQLLINYAYYHNGKIEKTEFKKINGHEAVTCTIKFPKEDKHFHILLAADADIYYVLGAFTDDKNPPEDFLNKFSFVPFKYKYLPVVKEDPLSKITYARPDWSVIEHYANIMQEEKSIRRKELKYPVKGYETSRFDFGTDGDTLNGDYKSAFPIDLPTGEKISISSYSIGKIAPESLFKELQKIGVLKDSTINMTRYHFYADSLDKNSEKEFTKSHKAKYLQRFKNKKWLDTLYWENGCVVMESISGSAFNSWADYSKDVTGAKISYSISMRYDRTRGISDVARRIVESVRLKKVKGAGLDSVAFASLMLKWLNSTDSLDLFRAMDNRYNCNFIPDNYDDTLLALMKRFDKNTDWGAEYAGMLEDKLFSDKYQPLIGFYMDKYRRVGDTSETQAKMLSNLGKMHNKKAIDTMIYWLLEETPLAPENGSSGDYSYSGIITNAYDTLKLWKDYYGKLLPLTRYREYEDAIMALGITLLDSNFIDSSIFSSIVPNLALSFRDDLKRKMSKTANGYSYDYGYNSYGNNKDDDFGNYEYGTAGNRLFSLGNDYGGDYAGYQVRDYDDYEENLQKRSVLYSLKLAKVNEWIAPSFSAYRSGSNYRGSRTNTLYDKAKILAKFYKHDPEVAKRLDRIFRLKEKEEKMLYVDLFFRNKLPIPDTMYKYYLGKKDCEFGFVQMLKKYHQDEKIPAGYFEEKNYATSFVYYHHFSEAEDSVVFVGKKSAKIESENGNLYFWKSRAKDKKGEKNEEPWSYSMVWIGSGDTVSKLECPRYFKLNMESNKKLGVKEMMNNEAAILQYWRHYFWEPLTPEEEILRQPYPRRYTY